MSVYEKENIKDNLKRDTEKVLLPAMQTFQYVLANFVRGAGRDVNLSLDFKVSTHGGSDPSGPVQASIICPNEFGDVCVQVSETIVALGGSCRDVPNNKVCELPPLVP